MASQVKAPLSPAEYLFLERRSEQKHELVDGELIAMTGASEAHNLIVANLLRELGVQLKGRPSKLYPSDMRVRIPAEGRYVYPNVCVLLGEAEFEDDQRDTLLNPQVIVEVLSDSTEAYDRGDKFFFYRTLPSFREYVLIVQDRPQIEHYLRREGDEWVLKTYTERSAVVELSTIGCRMSMGDVYYNVPLET
jgi:Uma2 family endonuclease